MTTKRTHPIVGIGAAVLVALHIASSTVLAMVMLETRNRSANSDLAFSEAVRALSIAMCGESPKL